MAFLFEQIENEEVIHENLADEQVPVFRAKFDYVRKDRRERVFILESTIAAIVSCKKDIKLNCIQFMKKSLYTCIIKHVMVIFLLQYAIFNSDDNFTSVCMVYLDYTWVFEFYVLV